MLISILNFKYSILTLLQESRQFHQPRNSDVNNDTTPYAAGVESDHTKDVSADDGTNLFSDRLTEMEEEFISPKNPMCPWELADIIAIIMTWMRTLHKQILILVPQWLSLTHYWFAMNEWKNL